MIATVLNIIYFIYFLNNDIAIIKRKRSVKFIKKKLNFSAYQKNKKNPIKKKLFSVFEKDWKIKN